MENTIKMKLETEVERLLDELSMMAPDNEMYEETTSRLDDLYTILNKEKALELDSMKLDIEKKAVKTSKVIDVAKTGIEFAGLVVPIIFYGVWMRRGLEFEKEGSFTSTTFKGLVGKFRPTK